MITPSPTDHHRYRHDRGSDVRKTTGSAEDFSGVYGRVSADGAQGKDARKYHAGRFTGGRRQVIERAGRPNMASRAKVVKLPPAGAKANATDETPPIWTQAQHLLVYANAIVENQRPGRIE